MTPTFSEDEYRRIMTLAFLGEWMLNAIRKDPDPAFEDTVSKVYSFAEGTPLGELVEFHEEDGIWEPSEKMEDDAHALIDNYDEVTFWEELTARLTERDMIEEQGERAVGAMRPDQRERAAAPIAKAYTHEFEEVGLDRLRIQE